MKTMYLYQSKRLGSEVLLQCNADGIFCEPLQSLSLVFKAFLSSLSLSGTCKSAVCLWGPDPAEGRSTSHHAGEQYVLLPEQCLLTVAWWQREEDAPYLTRENLLCDLTTSLTVTCLL